MCLHTKEGWFWFDWCDRGVIHLVVGIRGFPFVRIRFLVLGVLAWLVISSWVQTTVAIVWLLGHRMYSLFSSTRSESDLEVSLVIILVF